MWGKRRVYLDYAAGAGGNASSPHAEGRALEQMLEDARTSVARLTEVQADDVVFTSGATESNALAIIGYVRGLRDKAGKDAVGRNNMHVLYLPSAHISSVGNVGLLAEEGIAVDPLPIKDCRVDSDALAKLLRKETVLVTMEAVCGETGTVWNTREVKAVIEAFNKKIALHVDASQAPATEKISRAHFAADLLTFDGAKVGVPGIGALIAHRTLPLTPFYRGGGQERGLHPGSEAPARAREFAAALSAAALTREEFRERARQQRSRLVESLRKAIPSIVINEGGATVPHILNISLVGRDTDYLVALLDEEGFAVSTRSACETDTEEGSRAVRALFGDRARAAATLRISWDPSVSARALERFSRALVRAVSFIDTHSSR